MISRIAFSGLTYVSTHHVEGDDGSVYGVMCFTTPEGDPFELRYPIAVMVCTDLTYNQTGAIYAKSGVTWHMSASFDDTSPDTYTFGGKMNITFISSEGNEVKIEWSNYHQSNYVYAFQIGDKKFVA